MKESVLQQGRTNEKLRKRMERFDTVVYEYLRTSHKTVEELAKEAGCGASSLWRFRRKPEDFRKAPFDVICTCLRLANVSNDTLRFIIGIPATRGFTYEN